MKRLLCLLILSAATIYGAELLHDDFSQAELADRAALRGEWTFEEGVASCVSDPELYVKFQNHGPILRWSREFVDGSIAFQMKPQGCSRVVFTLNGDGHVFRVIHADTESAATATRIIAWAEKSSKQNKGEITRPADFPTLNEMENQWVPVTLFVSEGTATLTVGAASVVIENVALARDKAEITLGFADGTLAVRDFTFDPKMAE